MKRGVRLWLAALVLTTGLAGCGKGGDQDAVETLETGGGDTAVEADVDPGTEESEQEEDLPDGMYRNELTNELIDEALKDQRPIAAMVDNESIALPHYGLSKADVVYEMMNSTMNGRITRFMALFKDYESVEQIGSIRSVRPTNVILSAEWNAILCHDGSAIYSSI